MLRICQDCTAAFAVGLALCPQCGSERAIDQDTDPYRGDTMPKITRHGGATFAADIPAEGGEQPSQTNPEGPGAPSSPSETKADSTPETSSTGASKRARTTGSRTGRAKTGSSTARSTATGQTAPTSKTDGGDA